MSRTVVIHQPDFLPHLGFFHRFFHADLWVILDDVQFVKGTSRSWQNRDIIKTPQGGKWITVGIKKCPVSTKINEVFLSDNGWEEKNLNLLTENYREAPFFNEIMPFVEKLYKHNCKKMIEFNLNSVSMLLELFDIKIETVFASSLAVTGQKNERLINILNKVGAAAYLSGTGSKDYLDTALFEAAGISVVWQNYNHPVYPQLHGEFIPYLSSIDLLFNCGIEQSKTIIRSC
jgi:hypothetical protein